MLVSTKVLSFMPFVSTGSNPAAHMKPLIEQSQGLSLRMLVGFRLPDKGFNLLREGQGSGSVSFAEEPEIQRPAAAPYRGWL